MAKHMYSEQEILRVHREAGTGETVVEVCSKHSIIQLNSYI
jgi:hypothetical protein